MGKIYHLDLRTLLESLSQQNATLSTELPKGIAALREACTGYIYINTGHIVQCSIFAQGQPRIQGQAALQLLEGVQEWYVELERARTTPPLEAPGVPSASGPMPAIPPNPRISQALPPIPSNPRVSSQLPPMPTQPYEPPPQVPFAPSPQVPVGPTPARSFDDMVPRQLMPLAAAHTQALATKDRLVLQMVLVMVDGHRRVGQIKDSLQLAPQTVEQVLEYLRQLHIIEIV